MTDRRDAAPAYRWDLTAIYESEDAFRADCDVAARRIEAFPALRDGIGKGGDGLFAALEADTALIRLISKLYTYAMLASDLDKGDNAALARLAKVDDIENAYRAAAYFLAPAIQAIDEEALARYFEECPALSAYRRPITLVRREIAHMLSEENERLLAALAPALGTHREIRSIFANADLTFGRVKGEGGLPTEVTNASYVPLLRSTDRRVRRAAFRRMYTVCRQYGNTLAALLSARVREKVTLSKLRHFESSLAASVYSDEVSTDVYTTLIKTVRENLAPLFDYYDLKREVLGLSHLHLYDVYAPLTAEGESEYTYDEAVAEVLEAVAPLGKEYTDVLRAGLCERGWVDVYPGRGKRSGAYSAGSYDTEPYILLNFMGKIDDVSTLAHEAGHSMHSYFSKQANTPQEADYTIFVAEVASTVNELLFTRHRLAHAKSREERLSLLDQIMDTYKGTLYRQTMFAEFELTAHNMAERGEALTCESLSTMYLQLNKDYFGPRVSVDEDIALEWSRIPHFYSCFYVYKYATCISAASAIVKRIENEGDAYVSQYLSFLRAGGSRSPLESLRLAGIDMTDPAITRGAIADFAEAIAEFRRVYAE